MYTPQYLNSPTTASSCSYFNQNAGNVASYTWTFNRTPKHCAESKCGKPCHVSLYCKILKKSVGNMHKCYCSKCDITFESDLTSCDKDEIPMIDGVYP